MSKRTIVALDPGMSTGVVVANYTPDTELEVVRVDQIEGGIIGLNNHAPSEDDVSFWVEALYGTVISERFTPRPLRRSYKSNELEPLRIEGFLMAEDIMPYDYKDRRWRSPQYQVLLKGEDAAESKKLSDNLLREHNLWHTGKQVGCKDANDVNSAMKHVVSYLVELKHEPTLEWFKE